MEEDILANVTNVSKVKKVEVMYWPREILDMYTIEILERDLKDLCSLKVEIYIQRAREKETDLGSL